LKTERPELSILFMLALNELLWEKGVIDTAVFEKCREKILKG
jgi:hypothetical protein